MAIKLVPLAKIMSNVGYHNIPTKHKVYKICNTPHRHIKPIKRNKKPITQYNTGPSFSVFLMNRPVLAIFFAIEPAHASEKFLILIFLRSHILTVSKMTSLSFTKTWKHFRRARYQLFCLSLCHCFVSRFPTNCNTQDIHDMCRTLILCCIKEWR